MASNEEAIVSTIACLNDKKLEGRSLDSRAELAEQLLLALRGATSEQHSALLRDAGARNAAVVLTEDFGVTGRLDAVPSAVAAIAATK